MHRIAAVIGKAIEYLIAACLLLMTCLVFANVIARYGFDSGIPVSEEVSRYCLVWLVFLGAITALRDHAHLGVDTLVRRLPPLGKKLCFVASSAIMLVCCWIMLRGSLHHMELARSNVSPVTGISQSWLFLAGVVAAAGMGGLILLNLFRLFTGKLDPASLVQVSGEEG